MRRLILAVCVIASSFSWGQVLPVGSIDGTVKDPSGAVLPAVQVHLSNLETGISRTAEANTEGYFVFPLVNPGRYEVAAEKTGFKKGTQEIVRTGIRSTADFSLQLGQINESVSVPVKRRCSRHPRLLDQPQYSQRVVTDMPLLARNVLMLVNLSPGITNNSPTSDPPPA